MLHCHIPQEVHWVELALLVHYMVSDVVAAHENFGALSIAEKLLGFCIRKIERQADWPFPVFADGFKHLESKRKKEGHEEESPELSIPTFSFSACMRFPTQRYLNLYAAALKTEGL